MTLLQRVAAILGLTTILALQLSCSSVTPAYSMQATTQPSQPIEDPLEMESKKLAGPHSIDCGRVGVREDPRAATHCALAAQKAGKPFRIRYDLQGIDSQVAVGIVRTPTGSATTFMYDSDPAGGGRVGGGVVYPHPCPEPVQFRTTRSGRLNCFPPNPSTQRDAMSANAEPY